MSIGGKYIALKFPFLFGILFSLIGIIIGVFISHTAVSKDYEYFYFYSGIAGFITAWISAFLIIERTKQDSDFRLIITSIIVGLLSHWLCWYLVGIELNIRYHIFKEYFFEPPMNLFVSVIGVFAFCLWSWLFFGWVTVLGSILSIYMAKYLKIKWNNNNESTTMYMKS